MFKVAYVGSTFGGTAGKEEGGIPGKNKVVYQGKLRAESNVDRRGKRRGGSGVWRGKRSGGVCGRAWWGRSLGGEGGQEGAGAKGNRNFLQLCTPGVKGPSAM